MYCKIVPGGITAAEARAEGASALILSGGPNSILDDGAAGSDPGLLDLAIPLVGVG